MLQDHNTSHNWESHFYPSCNKTTARVTMRLQFYIRLQWLQPRANLYWIDVLLFCKSILNTKYERHVDKDNTKEMFCNSIAPNKTRNWFKIVLHYIKLRIYYLKCIRCEISFKRYQVTVVMTRKIEWVICIFTEEIIKECKNPLIERMLRF